MLAIIGCGNANRSDDAVGVRVAQALQAHLQERPRSDVRVFDAGTGGMEVMFHARGMQRLVIIDASSSGSEPGSIFSVPGSELEAAHDPSYSLHDFRWDHALAAGRRIFRDDFPSDVTVYLVEAASLDFGLEMSEAVNAAAEKLVERLIRLIDGYEAGGLGSAWATLFRGSIQLPREVCDRCFPGSSSVALVNRDGRLLIVPLASDSAGGLLLKVRNARGDRVIQAQEFLRQQTEIDEFEERQLELHWHPEMAALEIQGLSVKQQVE